jgi:hypothetical protein
VFVPFAVISRQVTGVVGGVNAPPHEASSSLLLKVWSRLDTRGAPVQNLDATAIRAPEARTAREVTAHHLQAAVLGHYHLVMRQVVHRAALIALALSPRLPAWLYGHFGSS